MQVELTENQIQALLQLLNVSNFKGSDVELVAEIKKKLKEVKKEDDKNL